MRLKPKSAAMGTATGVMISRMELLSRIMPRAGRMPSYSSGKTQGPRPASQGIASISQHDPDFSALFRRADRALNEAKLAGHDRVIARP